MSERTCTTRPPPRRMADPVTSAPGATPLCGAGRPRTTLGAEAKALSRPARVERSSRLPVRLRRVPADLALEPGQPRDQLDELADRDLLADAEVDRAPRRRSARRRGRSPRPRRRRTGTRGTRCPCPTPRCDPSPASRRVDALLDQRRDHVRAARVEVVARAVEVDRDQVDDVEAVLLRDRPVPGRGASSWPGRTARWSPPGSRSRGRPRGTAPA